ncbi:methyl-accepting chemotaxis protein [Iodobacter fluviatilis]|uniref:Chemotaxis regulator BdlA n=1 Tax=Iodobacter fluviatilis TaxID=537 RepID=A0A377QAA8_9NEIS|nr:methyl-accepting chemotaxis protein [Iodobacter fluviatilis]TCU82420.1 methyl-accepting chemotaxis protein [Iodobacter fluviatilis]STQ91645.1 Chemotaxis regulator BdlA [Iodobacter fluviatilis]
MNISQRLTALIAVALLSLLSVMLLGVSRLNDQASRLKYISEHSMQSALLANRIANDLNQNRIVLFVHILSSKDQEKAEIIKFVSGNRDTLMKNINAYSQLVAGQEDGDLYKKLQAAYNDYDRLYMDAIKLSDDRDFTGAFELANVSGFAKFMAVIQPVNGLVKFNDDYAKRLIVDADEANSKSITLFWVISGLGIVLVLFIGILIYRAIKKPMADSLTALSHIEKNLDFTGRIPVTGNDEISHLVKAVNHILSTVQNSFISIEQSITQMAGSAVQVSANTQQLSKISAVSSESAAHMAATVEEVTVSINHVAERARDTKVHTQDSGRLASDGERVINATVTEIDAIAGTVREASAEMSDLQSRSNQIRTVVNEIKEIADQTNLLALNAAIEAARAGELGRGFAVVADEVRKLAERTSRSTQEIANTVSAIQEGSDRAVARMRQVVLQVEEGVAHARDAGSAIANIRVASGLVVNYVVDISEALVEQSSASTAMAQQVEKIAHMSEQTNDAAVHSAASADQLQQLIETVKKTISGYRLR